MLTTKNIDWLAGLVEGEGCFYMCHPKGRRKHIRFQLKMCDEDIVRQVAAMIGMKSIQYIPPQGNNKALWRINSSGKKAEALMWSVFPYMGERRKAKIMSIGFEMYQDRLIRAKAG